MQGLPCNLTVGEGERVGASCAADAADAPVLLDVMYRAEAGKLSAYFHRRLKGDDEPADYVQEVFARLARLLPQGTVRQPRHYLRRIARNLLFERSRRLRTRVLFNYVPISPACEPSVLPDQEQGLEMEDVMVAYRRALDDLPARTREVFVLHRVDDLTYREIGEQLGITIPTVQYHVARALAHLDAALGQE
ncbi:MAG: RNA polymerase sigma factor [Sphingomonadales bacterium]|nr:RNA polymerase sigma factor [Sphingomonadales bacterium]MDE2169405.1 RNA polymerase sigma factor [Sphingomonadales bacterium]